MAHHLDGKTKHSTLEDTILHTLEAVQALSAVCKELATDTATTLTATIPDVSKLISAVKEGGIPEDTEEVEYRLNIARSLVEENPNDRYARSMLEKAQAEQANLEISREKFEKHAGTHHA